MNEEMAHTATSSCAKTQSMLRTAIPYAYECDRCSMKGTERVLQQAGNWAQQICQGRYKT